MGALEDFRHGLQVAERTIRDARLIGFLLTRVVKRRRDVTISAEPAALVSVAPWGVKFGRGRGRPRDSNEVWQQKRDELRTKVITVAQQGWGVWPDRGPNQTYVASRLMQFKTPKQSEALLRDHLNRYRLDFTELVETARPRINLRKCSN